MDAQFKVETLYDLSVHREFSRSYLYASPLHNAAYILLGLSNIYLVTRTDSPFLLGAFFLVALIYLFSVLLPNRKRGDINYRRALVQNNGKPPHMVYEFRSDGIQATAKDTGNVNFYGYDQFHTVVETPNLLILTMPCRLCLVLQKWWLTGGTEEALKAHLLASCPNIRKKRIRSIRFGTWIHRIYCAILILGTLWVLINLPGFSLLDRFTGRLHNDMTYQEMAEALQPLGITISDRTIEELEAFDAEYAPGQDYYDVYADSSKILDLLYWEGSGIYDEETWEWTPSTSGIFWFDMEVMNVGTMYTELFAGIQALDEALAFTGVQEDCTQADIEAGTGTVAVSFDYAGGHYQLDADYYYDWLDMTVLFELCQITAHDGKAEDLFYALDGGQGCYVYYGTEAEVTQLERKSGLRFYNTATGFGF